ncbi:hypothetical protein EIN_062710 [Entamoeba invadens IP1]|uniref:hypothetical protein n=1 Tax=Entamoeba invadens IP1 TaxID=370355 RepID=UPI0002C3F6C0|nr:hypothetical protein EIN_062710 [Entamoeba invadens IP1]ELP93576.1 hypothetical protein EIN_062710 [Entamoeba invadens IP1]|eukprot:XP_004260347.1 hypothetical protein EIN_062710 [Entamoeba invadens IP1]
MFQMEDKSARAIAQFQKRSTDLLNLIFVNKKFQKAALSLSTNPFPLTENTIKLFPVMQYQTLYKNGEDRLSSNCVVSYEIDFKTAQHEEKRHSRCTKVVLTLNEKNILPEIPSIVSTLGKYLFKNFDNFKNPHFVVPTQITNIENHCFEGCDQLCSIEFPPLINTLRSYCCYKCAKLDFVGLPMYLEEIEDFVFTNCTSLKKIVIPRNVTKLGKYLFYNCRSLSSISLPEKLVVLDEFCFGSCGKLNELVLPETVSFLGNSCFENCFSLKKVVFPSFFYKLNKRDIGTVEQSTQPVQYCCVCEDFFEVMEQLTTVECNKPKFVIGDQCFNGTQVVL